MNIRRLDTRSENFAAELSALTAWSEERDAEVSVKVADIIRAVRRDGDAAVLEYTNRFDRRDAQSVAALEISHERMQQALNAIPKAQREALEAAAERVTRYHEKQKQDSWSYREADGTLLGQQVTPLDRAGIYVPGGKAAYPSSVLMNALPAKVAGVAEIIMVSPAPGGELNDTVLAAAAIAGVDRFFTVGGAQAVAALAYGTETIAKVDKITGPGNIFVTLAKKQVYGTVDIDMLAGPSEILILTDESGEPKELAADLLSQAEHDTLASAILVSPNLDLLERTIEEVESQLLALPRADIARASWEKYGAAILVKDVQEGMDLANLIAPEHFELVVKDPFSWLGKVKNAGAVFLGRNTPEPVGDYFAGPNHVLPTGGTARFYSVLDVDAFIKKISVINYSEQALQRDADEIMYLARSEGLEAHARAIEVRKR